MDPFKLSAVETDVVELEQAHLTDLATLDPERWPQLHAAPIEGITELQAAVSPDCSYRFIQAALAEAEDEILLYIYNVSAGHLLDLLRERRDAGVSIRIMYDVHDTRGGERDKLAELGVDLKEAPSTGGRKVFSVCHQKFLVIDRKVVIVESANWAASAIPLVVTPGKFKKGNREWLLRIDNQPMAEWFTELFEADWNIPVEVAGVMFALAPEPAGAVMAPAFLAKAPEQIFDLASFTIPNGVRVTPLVSPDNYFDVVRKLILDAQQSVDVQQQYILAGGPKTEGLLEALEARKDEIEIRLMVSPAFRKEGAKDSWELSGDSLDAYGLKDRLRAMNLEYYTHCHNKGVIVDRRIVVVSSTNWSENSVARAREAGVVVESPDVAEYFARVFDFDWDNGWDAADVPRNLMGLVADAMFRPDGFVEIHPADLA